MPDASGPETNDVSPANAGDSLPHRILREATRLFAERGFSATSMREVAEAAGCTKPALYYHFGSKDALFVAALRAETEAIEALIEAPMDPSLSLREHLVTALRGFFAHLDEAPMGMRLVMLADLRPEAGQPRFDFESLQARHNARIRELLVTAHARGELREDLCIDDAVCALTGLVDQRLQAWLRGESPPADLPERLVSLFFYGVAR
ncbi:MAG: TetR/AcrR family transcriptional regulator [Myxococcales bacterium]|nr:TetR/AcrR family transcriptional regulator [Myxococcales bacterium]